MNRDDIIRMADEALDFAAMELATVNTGGHEEFNRLFCMKFAALVAAAEREACALVVENCCSYCAERIRERDGKPRKPMQHPVSVDDITKAALKILDAELTKQGLKS